jgi:GNAT superfamily N-acetyltransferase
MPSNSSFQIRQATAADVPAVLTLIRGLADYERLANEVIATEDDLRQSLFGTHPAAEVLLGELEGHAVAFAVFFTNFSTFLGRPGIYLEDLFVQPEQRRHGFGRQLLQYIAALAVERRCGRLEWSVLDWNEPAIRFYQSLGARPMDEWTVHRLTGEALLTFARS